MAPDTVKKKKKISKTRKIMFGEGRNTKTFFPHLETLTGLQNIVL